MKAAVLWLWFLLTLTVARCYDNVDGELRLMSSAGLRSNYGRVEIYHYSYTSSTADWGTIEYSSTISQKGVAQVVCRQMGYYGYLRVGTVVDLGYDEADSETPVILRDVDCPFDNDTHNALQHILRCEHEYVTVSYATPDHSLDLAVECSYLSIRMNPYDTQIDLIQGSGSASGYVLIYLNRLWGPVCNMGNGEADIACRQLGYTDAYSYSRATSGLIHSYNGYDQVSEFTCYSTNHACLRSCFKYPKANSSTAFCPDGYSYIVCEYEEDDDYFSGYGSKSLCTPPSLSNGAILAITMGALVLGILLCVAMVAVCMYCCCVPGCLCYNVQRRRVVTYEVIQ